MGVNYVLLPTVCLMKCSTVFMAALLCPGLRPSWRLHAGMSSPVVHSQGSAYDVFILYVTFSKEMPENIIFVILLLHFRTEHLVSVMSHLKELSISLKSQYKQASNLYISGNTLFVYFKRHVMTLLLSNSAELLNNSVI